MYKSRIQIFEDILSPMIDCFGNSDYEVIFWRKLQGYGLRASDFQGRKGGSRRVFSHWKNFMLERKWIRVPRVKRGNILRYAISPLGICQYSSIMNKISEHYGNKIFEILSSYSLYETFRSLGKIRDIITEKEAHRILKNICDSIDLIEINDGFQVVLSYKSRDRISYEISRYIIKQNQVYAILPEDMQTIESFHNPEPVSMPKIDDKLFYSDIAEFIIESFCYSIIENYHWKIINKSKMLNWKEISSKKKSEIKSIIDEYKKILEEIPLEIHLTANNFIGQNFGTIRQEEKLFKEISDYYQNKIAPKHGLEFEKGNPLDLFSN